MSTSCKRLPFYKNKNNYFDRSESASWQCCSIGIRQTKFRLNPNLITKKHTHGMASACISQIRFFPLQTLTRISLKSFPIPNLIRTPKSKLYSHKIPYSTMSSNESMPKKSKADHFTIGTHSGNFHCDEVLACFMIKQLPVYSDAKIIRSRDDKVLDECDMVIDVGGVFNHELKRYDHHQKEFQESISSLNSEIGEGFKIRLSSAGLIYTFYGEDIIQAILKKNGNEQLSPSDLKAVYKQIYKSLIQEIDAIDNGVPMFDGEPLYTISTNLSARIGNLNPSWDVVDYDLDEIFKIAMAKVGEEFTQIVMGFATSWIKARSHVRTAIENAKKVHESGEIVEFERFCPWKNHLADLEKEYNIEGVPKYVLFQEKPDSWRVMCVPHTPSSFVCRKFLRENWRGLRDEELSKLAGIPGLIFVHHTGFVGGATTRESVLKMAIQSLEN